MLEPVCYACLLARNLHDMRTHIRCFFSNSAKLTRANGNNCNNVTCKDYGKSIKRPTFQVSSVLTDSIVLIKRTFHNQHSTLISILDMHKANQHLNNHLGDSRNHSTTNGIKLLNLYLLLTE